MDKRRKRLVLTVTTLLLCLLLLLPAAQGVTVEDGTHILNIEVAVEDPEGMVTIEDDVPLGLPAEQPCSTHYLLLAAAAVLGIVYGSLLLKDRRELNRLNRELKENAHG